MSTSLIESQSGQCEGKNCSVLLYTNELIIDFSSPNTPPIRLTEGDIYCVTELQNAPEFVVHAFPFQTTGMLWWKKEIRVRQDYKIKLDDAGAVNSFVQKIRCVIQGLSPQATPLKAPHYFVIINPAGGTGVANQIYRQTVKPLFDLAGAKCTEIVSEKRGSVPSIIRSADFNDIDAIVTVSGDGTIHEVLNGIMGRPDWKKILQIPLGCVPGGSGNALACSVGFSNPMEAALAIIKGKTQPLDICSIIQSGTLYFGFLTISWAIASDVDIESEVLRWMGDLRFTLWAVYRMIFLRRYRGQLDFIPQDDTPPQNFGRDIEEGVVTGTQGLPKLRYIGQEGTSSGWTSLNDNFTFFMASNCTHQNKDMITTPKAKISDGAYDLCFVRNCSRFSLLQMFLDVETGAHVEARRDIIDYHKVKAFKLRLDPSDSQTGHLAIDGERFPYESFECEVHPQLWKVFRPK